MFNNSPKIKKVLKIIGILAFFVASIWIIKETQEKHFEFRNYYRKELAGSSQSLIDGNRLKQVSFGFSKLLGDKYWIDTILYTGENAWQFVFKKALDKYIRVVIALNPNFYEMYPISINLTTSYSPDRAIEVGLEGMKNSCDMEKVTKILNNKDLINLDNLEMGPDGLRFKPDFWKKYADLKNPCKSYEIPYSIAGIYLVGRPTSKNAKELAINKTEAYKYLYVTMMHEDALLGALGVVLSLNGKVTSYYSSMVFWKDATELAKRNKSPETLVQNYELKSSRAKNLYEISQAFRKAFEKTKKEIYDVQELVKEGFLDEKFTIDPEDEGKKESERNFIYFYDTKTKRFDFLSKFDYQHLKN